MNYRACKRAGITDLHFHDLRQEATSRFFEKGLNVMEVATITGHKDLRMLALNDKDLVAIPAQKARLRHFQQWLDSKTY